MPIGIDDTFAYAYIIIAKPSDIHRRYLRLLRLVSNIFVGRILSFKVTFNFVLKVGYNVAPLRKNFDPTQEILDPPLGSVQWTCGSNTDCKSSEPLKTLVMLC